MRLECMEEGKGCDTNGAVSALMHVSGGKLMAYLMICDYVTCANFGLVPRICQLENFS